MKSWGMGHVNESLVYVLALKKNNWCLERTVVVHQAQNALTQPRKAPCKVSTRKMKPTWAGDQNTGLQSDPTACDSSHCLSVADKKVSAVTSIPLSRLCLGAPHVSLCSRHFTLIADTLTCTLATALPGPSPDTSPAWRAVGRTVHTQLAPCQPRTPWHRHNNSALPHRRELASDLQFLFAPLMAERELSQN